MNKELSTLNNKIDWIIINIANELTDESLIQEARKLINADDDLNKYGFTDIKTPEGGREVPSWKAYMKAQAETGEKTWVELNNEFKDHTVIVNLGLTTKLQHQIFRANHNRNFKTTYNRLKAYAHGFKPAAKLINDAFYTNTRDKKGKKIMGSKIPGHLVANAGAHNYPYNDDYESYLKNVRQALIRFVNTEYVRRTNREVLQLK